MFSPEAKRPRRGVVVGALAALIVAIPATVFAAHQFTDVPQNHLFHEDIDWLFSNEVTVGCNPSSGGDLFCPETEVDRGQMAAFMHRFAETFGVAGSAVTDASDNVTVDSTDSVSLASVDVTPKDSADVTLNAHVHISATAGAANFEVTIAKDSCAGEVIGAAGWIGDLGVTSTNTISVTGYDVADASATYHLCAAKGDGAAVTGTAVQRGLTANWAPTT